MTKRKKRIKIGLGRYALEKMEYLQKKNARIGYL